MAAPILEVEDLGVEFLTDHGWVRVVDGVSFSVGEGETLGLVGESGSGKTVTSLSVMQLIPVPPGRISGGSIRFAGRELVGMSEPQLEDIRGDDIAMVFQESMTSLNPAFTIGEQICEVVRRHRGCSRREARDRAVEVLELVQIPDPRSRLGAFPHEFSGGMRQRAAIAMALACDPKVLIADEPTTALDVTVQAQVLDLLRSLQQRFGMAILFVTHNLGVVADLCDRVAVMYAGRIVETATVFDLFESPQHPYTEGLLQAMPQLGERGKRLAAIPGTPPMPWQMPTGCRFHPRCPYAETACTEQDIPLRALAGDRHVRCRRVEELTLEGAQ
ncbi:MAG: ABC transporter ATP-binding protein [Gammaproteobacteria bacterium]|nr:MAG: ABC transporter ATP-binding protein [Gammaproteobacteria bacterium]